MAKDMINSTHVNLFRRADGRAFLPTEIINEVPMSLPAFHGFDERGVTCPTATKNIETEEYEALFKTKQNHADIFRNYNEGVSTAVDGYEMRKWQTKIASGYVKMDTALFNRPAAGVTKWEVAKQDRLTDVICTLEKQFFYGEPRAARKDDVQKGFQGLQKFVSPEMTLDAGGTGSELCSAYLVYFNSERGVSWLQGKNGRMEFGEERVETAYDANRNEYDVMKQSFQFFPGLAMQGVFTVVRIKNIDVSTANQFEDKNYKAFTDEMVACGLSLFRINRPNVCFTTRKGATMLGASRKPSMVSAADSSTILISGGQTQMAKDCDGGTIPVCVTDGLVDTETN